MRRDRVGGCRITGIECHLGEQFAESQPGAHRTRTAHKAADDPDPATICSSHCRPGAAGAGRVDEDGAQGRRADDTDGEPQRAAPDTEALKEIWVGVASSVMGLAESALRAVGIATYLGPTTSTLNQTLVVNGYNLVPSSTETVTSFYGQWTFWPGGPTLVQGQQQYSVVDPATNLLPVGTFDALVSTGSPFNIRSKYVELLVTANDGINVGTGPGQVPPVGSLIASFNLIAGFGWSYTAMPSSPNSVVSFRLTTPFGDIPLPFGFDASKGIADHSVLSQPVYLGNGYSIAPADPAGQIYVGTSGFLPYYTTVQSHGVFNLRDSAGDTVGSFEGVHDPHGRRHGRPHPGHPGHQGHRRNHRDQFRRCAGVGSVFNVMYENSDTTYVVHAHR